jgi:hypothetical protein
MMEGTSLFSLPEGMQVSHIQIIEDSIVVEVVATSSRHVARFVLKHRNRSIATIAGFCVTFPAQAVAFSCC